MFFLNYRNFENLILSNHLNIFLTGVVFRSLIFIILIFFPFYHVNFGSLSPLSFQKFADLDFYLIFGVYEFQINKFLEIYKNIIFLNFSNIDNRFPGPLFPLIISLTKYSNDFTILMSILIILVEIFTFYFWSKFFYKKFNGYVSLLFGFMPIPLYFGFLHSTDIIFYFFTSFIFLIYCQNIKTNKLIIYLLVVGLVLTRPACISVLLALIIHSLIYKKNYKFIFIMTIILATTIFYYLPYFIFETRLISSNEYFKLNLSTYLNFALNYITKFIYIFGFIKSDSGNIYFYLMRCGCAMIFLIGYFYSLKNYKSFDFLIINFTLIPIVIFLFPAYRYSLPISPILFMNFVSFVIFLRNKLASNN